MTDAPSWITREVWDALVDRAAELAQQVDAMQAENERLRDMVFAFNKTARAEALSDMAALDADFPTDVKGASDGP